ncbi:hypothetical protein QYF36_001419 [Acer negundo]|nr:hypothetical protein QYF36_001419 [Acer negundo]
MLSEPRKHMLAPPVQGKRRFLEDSIQVSFGLSVTDGWHSLSSSGIARPALSALCFLSSNSSGYSMRLGKALLHKGKKRQEQAMSSSLTTNPLLLASSRPAWSSVVPYLESGIEFVSASVPLAIEGFFSGLMNSPVNVMNSLARQADTAGSPACKALSLPKTHSLIPNEAATDWQTTYSFPGTSNSTIYVTILYQRLESSCIKRAFLRYGILVGNIFAEASEAIQRKIPSNSPSRTYAPIGVDTRAIILIHSSSPVPESPHLQATQRLGRGETLTASPDLLDSLTKDESKKDVMHTARSSSVNTALGARNPLRKSTTLTSEIRSVNKIAALGYSERSKAYPQLPHFGIAIRKLNRTVSVRLPLPYINRNLTNQRRQLKVGTVPAHPKRVILLKTASTSVPHPSTSKEDFRVWHKRLGKLGTKYLTGPNSCLYRYSLTLNGREKEESLSASEIGSAGTVWITCKLGVSLEVDYALVAERYEGRGRV